MFNERYSQAWRNKIAASKEKFRVKYNCDSCGKPDEERQSHFKKKKRHFCNTKCYSDYRRDKLPKHEQHAFKGGGMGLLERRKRVLARGAVNHAIRDGKLNRLPCMVCGELKSEAHHPDYNKPLEVKWLCDKHHHKIHENPELLEKKAV